MIVRAEGITALIFIANATNADALVMVLSQTGKARLWKFNRHNSDALVQCVVTDLRCKTVELLSKPYHARSGMTSAPAFNLSR